MMYNIWIIEEYVQIMQVKLINSRQSLTYICCTELTRPIPNVWWFVIPFHFFPLIFVAQECYGSIRRIHILRQIKSFYAKNMKRLAFD